MKKRLRGLLALLLAAIIVIGGMPAIAIEAVDGYIENDYGNTDSPQNPTPAPSYDWYWEPEVVVPEPEQAIVPPQQTIGTGASFNYNISNKVYGCTYNWYVDDESVVTINPKNGVVTAQGVGETKIYVDITFPDGRVKTLEAIATVEEWVDAEEVKIKNPASLMGNGEMYNFNRQMEPSSSNNKTYWIVLDADGNEIANTKKGTGEDIMTERGFFTAPDVGTYTIFAQCYRSRSSNKMTAQSDPWTVTVEE